MEQLCYKQATPQKLTLIQILNSLTNRKLEENKPTNQNKSALLNPFIDFCA